MTYLMRDIRNDGDISARSERCLFCLWRVETTLNLGALNSRISVALEILELSMEIFGTSLVGNGNLSRTVPFPKLNVISLWGGLYLLKVSKLTWLSI